MSKNQKKGFTIVELVIVIAVIAILAAILIPTFSSLIRKANLSSDMQAVREMNVVLKNYEAKNGKPENIDTAMKIIADAGYDVDAWSPLSKGYQVYWFKGDNICILYNIDEAKVEYPTDYSTLDLLASENSGQFFVYNQTFKKAIEVDFNPSSATGPVVTEGDKTYKVITSNSGNVTEKSYASVKIEMKEENGQAVSTGTYVISTKHDANATEQEKEAANKEAGELLYAIFTQISYGMLPNDAKIQVEPGTVINVKGIEWAPVKLFTGYFGSSDPEQPVVIDGMKQTSATGYTATYQFAGTGSRYYCSGFFGAIYGKTTIENVVFRNVTIERPANESINMAQTTGSDSNCTGLIGGIVNPKGDVPGFDGKTEVVIRNVKAENCTVTGVSRVGGLVGFIGGYSANGTHGLYGSVRIENCEFAGNVTSERYTTSPKNPYGTAGGLVGFINKDNSPEGKDPLEVTISGCKFSGEVKGVISAGLVAQFSPSKNSAGNYTNLHIVNCTVDESAKILASSTDAGWTGRILTWSYSEDSSSNTSEIDAATYRNCGITTVPNVSSGGFKSDILYKNMANRGQEVPAD